jgi:hypothetical protein
VEPLNPVTRRDDVDLICPVDGWRDLEARIEGFLRQPRPDMLATVFLVSGPSGTGRTSLAHYLAHLWRESLDPKPNDLLVHSGKVSPTFDAEVELWDWCIDFLNRMEFKDAEKWLECSTAARDLGVELRRTEPSSRTWADVQRFAHHLVHDLRQNQWEFVAIFEDFKNPPMVCMLKDIFKYVKACIILVVDRTLKNQAVIEAAGAAFGAEYLHLELDCISGSEVQAVADSRWVVCRAGQQSPLASILQDPFQSPPRSLKVVIRRLRDILALKQDLLALKQVNGSYPQPPLTSDDVRSTLDVLDRQSRER